MPYYNEVRISDYCRRVLNDDDSVEQHRLFKNTDNIQKLEVSLLAYAPPMGINLNWFKHIPKSKLDQIDPHIPAKFKWDPYRKSDLKKLLKKFVMSIVNYLSEFLVIEGSYTDYVTGKTHLVKELVLTSEKKACITALESLKQTCNVLLRYQATQRSSMGILRSTQKIYHQKLSSRPVLECLSPPRSRAVRIESSLSASKPISSSLQAASEYLDVASISLRTQSQSSSAKKPEQQIARMVALDVETSVDQPKSQLISSDVKRTIPTAYPLLGGEERKERVEVIATTPLVSVKDGLALSRLATDPMPERIFSPIRTNRNAVVVEEQPLEQFVAQSSDVMPGELAQTQLLITQKVAALSRSEARLAGLKTEHTQEKKKMLEILEKYRENKQKLFEIKQKKHQLKLSYEQLYERYIEKFAEVKTIKKQLVQTKALSTEQCQNLELLEQQLQNKFNEMNALENELCSLEQRYTFNESQMQELELQIQESRTALESVKSSFLERNEALETRVVELQAIVNSNSVVNEGVKTDLQKKEAQLAQAKEKLQSVEERSKRKIERHPSGGARLSHRDKDAELHKMAEVVEALKLKLTRSISEEDWQRLKHELAQKSSTLMIAEQQLAERAIKEAAQLNHITYLQKRYEKLEAGYRANLRAIELNTKKLIAGLKEEQDKLASAKEMHFNERIQELTDAHSKQIEILKVQYEEKEKGESDAAVLRIELQLKTGQLQNQFEIDKMRIRNELEQEFQAQFKKLQESYSAQIEQLKQSQAEQHDALVKAQRANLSLEVLVRDLGSKLERQTELLRTRELSLQETESRRSVVEEDFRRLQTEHIQKIRQLKLEFAKQKEAFEQDLKIAKEQYMKELQAKEAEIAAVKSSLKQIEAAKAELHLQMQQQALAKETIPEEPRLSSTLETELTELRAQHMLLMQQQEETKTTAEERVNKYRTQFQQAQQINDEQQKLYDDLEAERDGLLDDLERLTSEKNELQSKFDTLSKSYMANLKSPLRAFQKTNEIAAMHQETLQSSKASIQSPDRVSEKENKPITPKSITPMFSGQKVNAGVPNNTPDKDKMIPGKIKLEVGA